MVGTSQHGFIVYSYFEDENQFFFSTHSDLSINEEQIPGEEPWSSGKAKAS